MARGAPGHIFETVSGVISGIGLIEPKVTGRKGLMQRQ
jgi:hypothetical protein